MMRFISSAAAGLLLATGAMALPGFSAGAGVSVQTPAPGPGPGPGDKGGPRHERHAQRQHDRQQQHQQRQAQKHEQRQAAKPQQQGHWRQWQGRKGWQAEGAWRGRPNWEGNRAGHWQVEHRTWAQRGGYGGYYIPQNRFVVYFGPAHPFRIRTRPVIYMGYPRFYYGGYSYVMVDPYPEDWDPDWYASDDVYIDYNDGYYLYNRRHPGVAVAVMVVR